jgi:outer membrane protein assembly factor BamB
MSVSPDFPYGFIAAEHDARHQRLVEVSRAGALVRSFACDDLPLDVDRRADGRLLLTTRKSVIELDEDWREVWRHTIADVFVSACQWLPDGLILVADTSCAEIYVLDHDRKKIRDVSVPRTPDLAPRYNLFRNVRQLPDGRLLVACHHDRKIAEFDWSRGLIWHAPVEGMPYMALRLAGERTLVSLGPSGRIVELDRAGLVTARYDMTDDHGLERGWIAGITFQADGTVTFSDSKHDRLVAFDWRSKTLKGIFQNRNVLLHPSTHIILP